MYCGTCLRDNALATELLARGHDVSLLPVYTPTRTDETNVSDGHVFFGGISVYLEQHLPAASARRPPSSTSSGTSPPSSRPRPAAACPWTRKAWAS